MKLSPYEEANPCSTATKTLLLLLMVIAGAAYTWKLYYNAINPQSITGWMFGGLMWHS
ncbi:MAG: hypothetical protein IJE52_00515 [Bacteroidales bacterium]|nr:hypothetical protein [Bacteroidales bacterium]